MRARLLVSFLAGLLFGVGLVVSRMVDPAKVLGFLDLAGRWDPSLAFVMAGAVPVAALGYHFTGQRDAPLLDTHFHTGAAMRIDARLVVGSVLFGIGWGLVGYCPGPALTALALGRAETLIFVASIVAGMVGHRVFTSAWTGPDVPVVPESKG